MCWCCLHSRVGLAENTNHLNMKDYGFISWPQGRWLIHLRRLSLRKIIKYSTMRDTLKDWGKEERRKQNLDLGRFPSEEEDLFESDKGISCSALYYQGLCGLRNDAGLPIGQFPRKAVENSYAFPPGLRRISFSVSQVGRSREHGTSLTWDRQTLRPLNTL